MQAQEVSIDDKLTVEALFQKSEKLRKTMWGHHAGMVQKIAHAEEKLDWALDRLARLERTIDGR